MGNVLIKLRAIKVWRSVIGSNRKVADSTWAFPSLRKLTSSASTGNRVIDELPSHVAQHSIYGVSKSRDFDREARKQNQPGAKSSNDIEMQRKSNRILPSESRVCYFCSSACPTHLHLCTSMVHSVCFLLQYNFLCLKANHLMFYLCCSSAWLVLLY